MLWPHPSSLPFGGNCLCGACYALDAPTESGGSWTSSQHLPHTVSLESPPSVNPEHKDQSQVLLLWAVYDSLVCFLFINIIMGLKGPSGTGSGLHFLAVNSTLEATLAAMPLLQCGDHLTHAWGRSGVGTCVDASDLSILSAG